MRRFMDEARVVRPIKINNIVKQAYGKFFDNLLFANKQHGKQKPMKKKLNRTKVSSC